MGSSASITFGHPIRLNLVKSSEDCKFLSLKERPDLHARARRLIPLKSPNRRAKQTRDGRDASGEEEQPGDLLEFMLSEISIHSPMQNCLRCHVYEYH